MKGNSHPGHSVTPEELRAQVEDTREQLGHTVQALTAKADVRGRAQAKADQVRGQMRDRVGDAGARARSATRRGGGAHRRYDTTAQSRREKAAVVAQGARDKRVLAATGGTAALTAAVLMGRHRYYRRHH